MTSPLERRMREFQEGIEKHFPGLILQNLKYGNSKDGTEEWNHLHYVIYPQNSNLSRTPYFYKEKSVVHFTSFNALSSILSEKSMRLYNLHTLNDPREFTFASKMFQLNNELIDDAKDNLFIVSFSKEKILKKAVEEFNMWRLYGHHGKGVAIILSINNDPMLWNDFHCSEVVYGADNRINFSELFSFVKNLNEGKPTIDIDLGKLYAFHKSNLFRPEQEVRLIFDRREKRAGVGNRTKGFNNKVIFPIIKNDLLKLVGSNDQVRYLQIPIFHSNLRSKESDTPLLKIEEIIIGYNVGEHASKIKQFIESMCDEALGYTPSVTHSRLKGIYLDSTHKSKDID